jgi:threonine dehydrogenase-like Zn-dependent dehydrogenase
MKAIYFDNHLPKILALQIALKVSREAVWAPFSPVRYGEVPEPEIPGPRWLKVRNLACGLCGSDVHFMLMDLDPRSFPAALPGIRRKFLGHELVGEVLKIGSEVSDFKPGDRVALRIDWPSCFQLEIDPPCHPCASGHYQLCENLGMRELPLRDQGGGFSPYMVMHRSQPFRIPEGLDGDRALLLEPTATTLHGVRRRPPIDGERVLVIGAGTIGLLTVAVVGALAPGAIVCSLARYPFQAEAARRLGATEVLHADGHAAYAELARIAGARHIHGRLGNDILLGGFDVVYDTVGTSATIQHGLRWAKARGTVVISGISFRPGRIDHTPLWNQEVTLMGMNSHGTEASGRTSFEEAAELLLRPSFPVDRLITHRFPLSEHREALRTFLDKGSRQAIKIVLEHQS